MTSIHRAALGLFLMLNGAAARAATMNDVEFPDEFTVAGKKLALNGVGKRRIAFFSIYVAGLYVVKKSSAADEIYAQPGPKYLRLHFLRTASQKRIREAFEDGLKKNCSENCDSLNERMHELLEKMQELREKDEMKLSFFDDRAEIQVNNELLVKVAGADFVKALLAIWLGPKPPNEDLKKGLLGLL